MFNVEELIRYIEKQKESKKPNGVSHGFLITGYKDACSDILDKIDELQEKSYTILDMKCEMEVNTDYEAQYALG
jgi:hypothetical protein